MNKTPKGTRLGGRQKGTPNKRTIQRLQEASENIGAIRKLGQKKATEVLNDLMHIAMGMTAKYQQRLLAADRNNQPYVLEDYERFVQGMQMAGIFAKELAPFQDPKYSTIKVQMPEIMTTPGDGAREMGNVTVIDDAVAATRVYQRLIRRVG
jgi:hypothetical protein